MPAILLRGGRVLDPASGHDAIGEVLVRDGSIAALGPALPDADATVLDVSGCIVGPGFVDLHSHVHSIAGQRLQAMDGVTTSLDLEAGLMPIERAYAEAAREGRPLNYGFSASWAAARAQVLCGIPPSADIGGSLAVLGDARWQRTSSPSELTDWLEIIEGELGRGALGVGVLIGYAPRSDPAEFQAVARLAAGAGAPVYTHVRELVEADPQVPVDGVDEVVIAAAESGATMHHCHVNSTSRRHVDRVLATLDAARAAGSRVSVEAYPYGAGSTAIGAYFLDPDRLAAMGLRPSSIVLVGTGERIADEGRLREVRASDPGAPCVFAFLDEADPHDRALLHRSLSYPDAIVASDAMPVVFPDGTFESTTWPLPSGAATHPRTAGTFAKAMRLMVRETGTWTWLEAFRRAAHLPAQVLADIAPAMRGKGWLGVGADADVVVLDPQAISDTATYADPCRPSSGVRHLLVNGEFVVREGALRTEAFPGRPVRGVPR
jgi:cytosine/adenosine deaminase-related metal-dependent hydrolase